MRYTYFLHYLAASQMNALLLFLFFMVNMVQNFVAQHLKIRPHYSPSGAKHKWSYIITFLASLKNMMYRACRYNNKQKFGKWLYSVKSLEVESKLAKVHSCCGVDLILHSWLLSQHCKFLEVLINALHICFGLATHDWKFTGRTLSAKQPRYSAMNIVVETLPNLASHI